MHPTVPNPSFMTRLRKLVWIMLICLAPVTPGVAQEVPDVPNDVCNPDSPVRFRSSVVGALISGHWQGTAPGIGVTMGVQRFAVQIFIENGRLYMQGEGQKVALAPNVGVRKALRTQMRTGKPIPIEAQATGLSLEDIELVTDCSFAAAPQYQWESRGAGGFYSFVSPDLAIGSMWNRAGGTREVLLERIGN